MKKPKRISLALKVNIVIMAMVLSVSVVLILISENTYQKAVFRPYFLKLENTEVPVEELKPIAQEFRPYLGTEELNRIVSVSDTLERDVNLNAWFLNQAGLKDPPSETMMDGLRNPVFRYTENRRSAGDHLLCGKKRETVS